MSDRRLLLLVSLGLVASLTACGGDSHGPPASPAHVVITAGGIQNGLVGQALGAPLQVQVLDGDQRPVSGIRVHFAIDPLAGTLSEDSVLSDSHGRAASEWTLPSQAGSYTVKAIVPDIDSVIFSATASAGGPGQLTLVSSDSQTALVGAVVDSLVVVRVSDIFGNPVEGATVHFAVLTGGGVLSQLTVVSDSMGSASTQWTWGSSTGVQTVEATTGAVTPLRVTALRFPAQAPQRLSVGGQNGCWLDASGAAFCWGGNGSGQLGDGTLTTRYAPVPVTGGIAFRAIATSGSFYVSTGASTCGISVDSTAYCWGTGFPVSSDQPLPLANAPHLVSVTMGIGFGCGLTSDGIAYCWGTNSRGQLGDGTSVARNDPAPVAGNLVFRQVEAGAQHVCAIALRGGLYCWGDNLNFQAGTGTPQGNPVLTPTPIGGTVRFASVVASDIHSCALALMGGLYCWGNDGRGEVTAGSGTTLTVPVPTPVVTGLAFDEFGLGYERTCGLIPDGTAYCWGRNYEFALGDSIYGERATPAPVLGGHQFSQIDGDFLSTCAISTAEELFCWGTNSSGVVGVPDSTQQLTPVPVLGGIAFTGITSGLWHSCGLTATGAGYCWGTNTFWGEVGDGTNNPRAAPEPVSGGHVFASLDAGGYGTCGVDTNGTGYCWGRGIGGETGDGAFTNRNTPTPIAGALTLSAVSVGFGQACGLTTTGEAWCWGYGDAPGTPYGLPVMVISAESLTQISAGWRKSCALGTSGMAYCWTPRSDNVSPTAASAGGPGFVQIQTGLYYACGLTAGAAAYCWGSSSPVAVSGGLSFTSIGVSSDGSTTCGVSTTGSAYCWGNNDFGELGIGDIGGFYPDPTPVAGGLTFTQVSPSAFHSCGINPQGQAYCWGTGDHGALGNGATLAQPVPRRIQ